MPIYVEGTVPDIIDLMHFVVLLVDNCNFREHLVLCLQDSAVWDHRSVTSYL